MNIRDLKPGMNHVNMKVKVLSVSDTKQIITGAGVEHEILEVDVEDETGSITLVLWDKRVIPVEAGDALQIDNGFVTSFKGAWRVNVGRYGGVAKINIF